jgi:hypothetical protein
VLLQLVDKFGNDVERGEVRVDAKAFGPKASECVVEDKHDGTYTIVFTAGVPGDYRVQVRLENMEMSPLTVKVEARDTGDEPTPSGAEAQQHRQAHESTRAHQQQPKAVERLRGATNTLIEGMGLREDRRAKDPLMAAADAFNAAGAASTAAKEAGAAAEATALAPDGSEHLEQAAAATVVEVAAAQSASRAIKATDAKPSPTPAPPAPQPAQKRALSGPALEPLDLELVDLKRKEDAVSLQLAEAEASMLMAEASLLAAEDALERRIDESDGMAYTYEEFIEEYGGDAEWNAAPPAPPPPPAVQAAVAVQSPAAAEKQKAAAQPQAKPSQKKSAPNGNTKKKASPSPPKKNAASKGK